MEPFQIQSKQWMALHTWMNLHSNLVAGFTTKNDGVSSFPSNALNLAFHVGDQEENVQENRKRLAEQLDFPVQQWVSTEQVHGTDITLITSTERGKGAYSLETCISSTDGLITRESNILLTLCYADCVPLYFFDPVTKWIGVAHAGWKGTTGNIAGKMVNALCEQGAKTHDIQVAVGPSICEKCYKVDSRVISAVDAVLNEQDLKPYQEIEKGQFLLDLKKLNVQLLKNTGIPETNILSTDYCSSCDQELFFSHRRDQGKTGRMLSFIGWREN